MSEDEIIQTINNLFKTIGTGNEPFFIAVEGLLDLYQKEKERNTKLITQNSIRQYNDNEKIKQLKSEVGTMKEQLQMFIPRRRVRRVYKMLGKILEKADYGLEENNGKQM